VSPLLSLIVVEIKANGPLSIARYMDLALGHDEHGYYRKQDPFGAQGDFITAPEISQMFGEMVGLWCACVGQSMNLSGPLNLVEFGPGRGTLMADSLRAAKTVPGFIKSVRVALVETSPTLRAMQKQALAPFDVNLTWHDSLESVADGPLLVIGNEFFDALPIRQYVCTEEGWRERLVGLNADQDGLVFELANECISSSLVPESLQVTAKVGDIYEDQAASCAVMTDVATRISQHGGAALFFDYGHDHPALGDTFQAMKTHRYANVLTDPGEHDLTAHVDFEQLAMAARAARTDVFGPLSQGIFLESLGLQHRAQTLKASATDDQIFDVNRAYSRLTNPEQMGTLFRAMVIAAPGLSVPPWS